MDLAQLTSTLYSFWQKLPQQALARALMTLLVIYIAYWAASMTWLFVPTPTKSPSTVPVVNTSVQTSSRPDVDTSAISKLNLFGKFVKPSDVKQPVQIVESAPETKLQLTLTGLVASDDKATAAAIIESRGQQETYGIDDKISGTRAVLKQVHPDRVIIESSGRMETLMLDGFKYTKQVNATTSSSSVKPTLKVASNKPEALLSGPQAQRGARIKERLAQVRSDIADDPSKIIDYIKIAPHRVQGKIVGYRLMPSKKPDFFKEVGLLPGDIAVQINGRDLTDMREAQQALNDLRSAEHIDVLVDRDGVLHDISLGLDN